MTSFMEFMKDLKQLFLVKQTGPSWTSLVLGPTPGPPKYRTNLNPKTGLGLVRQPLDPLDRLVLQGIFTQFEDFNGL